MGEDGGSVSTAELQEQMRQILYFQENFFTNQAKLQHTGFLCMSTLDYFGYHSFILLPFFLPCHLYLQARALNYLEVA